MPQPVPAEMSASVPLSVGSPSHSVSNCVGPSDGIPNAFATRSLTSPTRSTPSLLATPSSVMCHGRFGVRTCPSITGPAMPNPALLTSTGCSARNRSRMRSSESNFWLGKLASATGD